VDRVAVITVKAVGPFEVWELNKVKKPTLKIGAGGVRAKLRRKEKREGKQRGGSSVKLRVVSLRQ